MNREDVSEYLADFQRRQLPDLVPRELGISESRKIRSIIGPRRAGKTFFLHQRVSELLRSGIRKENILFLNFEDSRLAGLEACDMREILKLHWQHHPASSDEKLQVFMDEPQNMAGWESAMRNLHDEGFDITLSGSSSKLLAGEMATALRGRTLTYLLLPFSFREFLDIRGAGLDTRSLGSRDRARLLGLLDEYLDLGGFPEVILEKSEEDKLRTLGEYFNMVMYRDIVERFKVRNARLVLWMLRSLAASFSREYSVHKTFLTLRSQGVKVSKNTVYEYLSMLEQSFFVFLLPRYSPSERKRELFLNKVYLCDTGFARLVETSPDRGYKMENAVFLELKRREVPPMSMSYWKNVQKEEVDFAVRSGPRVTQLIQVCHDISDPDVRKRELRPLLKASKELGCADLLVINADSDRNERVGGRTVRFLPLWKWLLERRAAGTAKKAPRAR